jgi:hypothetical protein
MGAGFKRMIAQKGNALELKHGRAHLHGDIVLVILNEFNDTFFNFDTQGGLLRQTRLAHVAQETTRAIATVLHFGAVRIVDHVLKIQAFEGGVAHAQNLIGTHPKMPLGNGLVLLGTQVVEHLGLIDDHKVVATALHFCKWYSHASNYQGDLSGSFKFNGDYF